MAKPVGKAAGPMITVVAVALAVPLARAFDYLLPTNGPESQCALVPGVRVRVPFGSRNLVGLVVQAPRSVVPEHSRYKALLEVLDGQPIVPADWLALLHWAAGYYHHPLGEVLAAALPQTLREGANATPQVPRLLAITGAGRAALPTLPARSARQREALQQLAGTPLEDGAVAAATVRSLLDRGWAAWQEAAAFAKVIGQPGAVLTPAQTAALASLTPAADGFAVHLLDGITGSGKTELYLERCAQVLAQGQQVLVLVPEIGLAPQLLARFVQRFGSAVRCSHSGMSESQRAAAWLAVRDGYAQVLVGTRSAVFAPFARLGLVVVDEEHDASFKQQDGFRYHARDLALVRARSAGAAVILGSATPSLESLANAKAGRYQRVRLTERRGGGGAPLPQLIDLKHFPARNGLSAPLAEAVTRHVGAGGQALLFINRRGFAPTLLCDRCHWLAPCPHCDARLTVHRGRKLSCHHCGYQSSVPAQCPSCGSIELLPLGDGTERIEEALKNLLPGKRVERFDSARFSTAKQLHEVLEAVRARQVDVLVGTQMLAKGHDFGQLSLVGVVNADAALYSADFRATERLGQLLVQVAGRAGRAQSAAGLAPEVLIQTKEPNHPALQTLLRQGYARFAAQLLQERRSAQLPPCTHMALLRAEAADAAQAEAFLRSAIAAIPEQSAVQVLGPATALMERKAGRYRMQLLLVAEQRQALQALLRRWQPGLKDLPLARKLRFALDVDPVDLG